MNQPSDPGLADDNALVAAIAMRADRDAFAELFRRYAGRIKGFLIRGGLDAGLSEETAQEVMVTIWRKAASFDAAKAGAATWIFTIARNRRIDLLRKMSRDEPDPQDPLFAPEPEATPEQEAEVATRDAQVRAAMATLTPDQLDVVRLAFFTGLSHGDIAERLGAPLGTVKSRLRLAFQRLRGELGADFSSELVDD